MRISRKLIAMSLVPIIMLMLGAAISVWVLKSNSEATQKYLNVYSHRQFEIARIYELIGYGKGIHNFKNFVLRGKQSYKVQAFENLSKAKKEIQVYLKLTPLSEIEKKAMLALLETIDQYLKMLDIADKAINNNLTPVEVDKLVKVDDTPAVTSLEVLNHFFEQKRYYEIQKLQSAQTRAFNILMSVFFIAFLIAILTSKNIAQKMLAAIKSLMKISADIARGSYDIKAQELLKFSDDELQQLGSQLVSMAHSLENAFSNLKQSNEDLEQFAFVASHDLQEPIKKISTFVDLLQIEYGDKLDENGHTYINKIKNSCIQARNLISSLLDYSRLMNTDLPLSNIDLNQVIKETLELLEVQIKELQAQIDIQTMPKVKGNFEMLKRVFQNLISNALKFRKENVVPIINITAHEEGKGRWKISVKDNGIGFKMDHATQILKPFGRAHRKTQYPGTGIGLASSKRILDSHKSEFIVESEEQIGSTFSFYLEEADYR